MNLNSLFSALLLFFVVFSVSAGTLSEGSWSPTGCGEKPDTPSLDSTDLASFNTSLGAVNEWERRSRKYNECLVKEANEDNNVIANTANEAQKTFREAVDALNEEAANLKVQLE